MPKRPLFRTFIAMALAHGLATVAAPSFADPLVVVNPGFEDISGEFPSNEFTFGPFNGWGLFDPATVAGTGAGPTYFIGTLTPFEPDPIGAPGAYDFFPAGAPEGQRVGIAFNFFGSGGQGEWGLVQVLGDTLQPNTTYTLRVRIGNIASGTSMGGGVFPLDGFPGYRVDLLAGADLLGGGIIVAQDSNSLGASIPDGEFAESVIEFTTGASHPMLNETLGIRLVSLNIVDGEFSNSDLEVDFDDVRLDASPVLVQVPALSGVVAAGLAFCVVAVGGMKLRGAVGRNGRSGNG